MRICEVRSVLAALALVVSLAPGAGTVASAASSASPLSTMGPQAIPASVSGPGYGLFSCQLGLSIGACYDPYQMQHAYGIDNLINAGFDGKGRTIIIVDAYQSPNIVEQLNTWNGFYGLPSLNGLGGAPNASLGTFTQVAPDGLTPFVTGDPNMTGWAEEISLDVLWAHAIAPGANIVLDLAKSNDDADILSATKYAVDHNLGDIISQSFGENESCVNSTLLKAQHQLFAKATLKGITLFASSGDQGAAEFTCDGNSWVKAASSPASDPLVSPPSAAPSLQAADYCLTALGCDPAANPAQRVPTRARSRGTKLPPFGDFQDYWDFDPRHRRRAERPLQGTLLPEARDPGREQRGVPDVSYNAAVLHGVLTYLDIPGIPVGFYRFGGTSTGLSAVGSHRRDRRSEGRAEVGLHERGAVPLQPVPEPFVDTLPRRDERSRLGRGVRR